MQSETETRSNVREKPTFAQPSWKRRAIVLLALPVLSLGAWHLGALGAKLSPQKPETPREAMPTGHEIAGLVIDSESLDLGEVWETNAFVCRLPIRNRSRDAVVIDDVTISCNCTSVTPRRMALKPGETRDIELNIDLTHRAPSELGHPERRFTVGITPVVARNSSRKSRWIVHGIVKSRLTLDTDFLQFGDGPVQGQPPFVRRVVATPHVPTAGLELTIEGKPIDASVRRRDDGRFELSVSPSASLPPGEFRSQLGIDVVSSEGVRLPGYSLPVAGNVQPALRMLPARVFLGSHKVGESASAVVVIQAPSSAAVKVERIETDSTDVTVAATEVEGIARGRAYRITQQIGQRGERQSQVRFFVRTDGQSLEPLAIEVHYRGESKDWKDNVGGRP